MDTEEPPSHLAEALSSPEPKALNTQHGTKAHLLEELSGKFTCSIFFLNHFKITLKERASLSWPSENYSTRWTWAETQFRDPEAHSFSSVTCEERKHTKANDGQGEEPPESFLP